MFRQVYPNLFWHSGQIILLTKYFLSVLAFISLASVCSGLAGSKSSTGHDGDEVVGEYELKAVYLVNFLHFVTWPKERRVEKNQQRIVIIGKSPIQQALTSLQETLQREKKFSISLEFYDHYQEQLDLSGCHLLFISQSEQGNSRKILSRLAGQPVLTVADFDGFAEMGGMISIVSYKNKVRWAINRFTTEQAGFRMSSKLYDIAVQIFDK